MAALSTISSSTATSAPMVVSTATGGSYAAANPTTTDQTKTAEQPKRFPLKCALVSAEVEGYLPTPLDPMIPTLRSALLGNFLSGAYDAQIGAYIEAAVKANELFKLKQLAYGLFSGLPAMDKFDYGINAIRDKHLDAAALAQCIQIGFGKMKVQWLPNITSCGPLNEWPLSSIRKVHDFRITVRQERDFEEDNSRPPLTETAILSYWEKSHKKDRDVFKNSDTTIDIFHGGGYYHLVDFLNGAPGYKLAGFSGFGIQVHPYNEGRSKHYARTKAADNFDIPCLFRAKIAEKYLDEAPNAYEAGLRAEHVQHLQAVVLEPLL
jgi:hypothetical protein